MGKHAARSTQRATPQWAALVSLNIKLD